MFIWNADQTRNDNCRGGRNEARQKLLKTSNECCYQLEMLNFCVKSQLVRNRMLIVQLNMMNKITNLWQNAPHSNRFFLRRFSVWIHSLVWNTRFFRVKPVWMWYNVLKMFNQYLRNTFMIVFTLSSRRQDSIPINWIICLLSDYIEQ